MKFSLVFILTILTTFDCFAISSVVSLMVNPSMCLSPCYCDPLLNATTTATTRQLTTPTTTKPAIVPLFSLCRDTNSSAATGIIQNTDNSRTLMPCIFDIIAPVGQQIQISCSSPFSFYNYSTLTFIGSTENVWPLPEPNRTYYSVGNTLSVFSKFEATDQFFCKWKTLPMENTTRFNFCRHGQSSSAGISIYPNFIQPIWPSPDSSYLIRRNCGFSIVAPQGFQISFSCPVVIFYSNESSLQLDGISVLTPLVLSNTSNDFKVNTTYYSTAKNEVFLTSNLVSGDWVDCNWMITRRENKTNFILCRDGESTAEMGTITPPRNGTMSLKRCVFIINAPADRRIEISCPVMSSGDLLAIDGITKKSFWDPTQPMVNETYYSTSENKVILYSSVNSSDWFSCNWTTVKRENTTNLKLCRDDQARSTSGTITPLEVYSNQSIFCAFSIKALPNQQIRISCSIYNMKNSSFFMYGLTDFIVYQAVVNHTYYSDNTGQVNLFAAMGSGDDWFRCSWSILPTPVTIFKLCNDRVSTLASGIITGYQYNTWDTQMQGCGFSIKATPNQRIQFSCSNLKLSSRSQLFVNQWTMEGWQGVNDELTPLLNQKYYFTPGNNVDLFAVLADGDGFTCQWTTIPVGNLTAKSLTQLLL